MIAYRNLKSARINAINDNIKKMAILTEKQLKNSIKGLENNDIEYLKKLIKNDDEIDILQKEIEEECVKFIATEQPVAKDLRRVFTASKIVTDVERMADYIVNICKIAIDDKFIIEEEEFKYILEMENKLIHMLNLAIDAYLERDMTSAYDICKLDDEIDELHKKIFKNALEYIKKDEKNILTGSQMMLISKYLERLGDHITNICEWIIFSKTGEYVDLNE